MSRYISRAESNTLYRTIKFVHDTFVENDIKYWITGGNLLGAVRHGGLIPWDDDGDVCIMLKDVPKLKKLVEHFKKNGYTLEIVDDDDKIECQKVKNSCDWFVIRNSPNALGLDIFVMKKIGNKITYANPYWEKSTTGGGKCYFLNEHVFPLIPKRFGNFYVYVPNNPVEHLNRCYNTDWNSKSSMYFNHRTGEWINSEPREMKSVEYKHPNAPKDTCESTPPPVQCDFTTSRLRNKKTSKSVSATKRSVRTRKPTQKQKTEDCRKKGLVYDRVIDKCRPSKRSAPSKRLSRKK